MPRPCLPALKGGRLPWRVLALALALLVACCGSFTSATNTSPENEPWRPEVNEQKDARLKEAVSALQDAQEAEENAAQHEKTIGQEKLQVANTAAEQAKSFMGKASKLLESEEALQDQQVALKKQIANLEQEHKSINNFEECEESSDCHATFSDKWENTGKKAKSARNPRDTSSRPISRAVHRLRQLNTGGKVDLPNHLSHDPGSQGKPYSSAEWEDTKPRVDWRSEKPAALKAGFELSNCLVAASKDSSTVEVMIMQKQKAIMTERGCTCQLPWHYFRAKGYHANGAVHESSNLRTFNRCSKNGSSKPWCAVVGDHCGTRSTDPHSGYGKDELGDEKYGWTHWDYCDYRKKAYQYRPAWSATHSAGEVTCLTDFLLATDRAAEWRALELLQQEYTSTLEKLPAEEVASRYEKCIMRATTESSAVFCEADMLRHLEHSIVRHALLLSRSDKVGVHWANRQRVALLYAKQLKGCLDAAQDRDEGVVCIAQLLSSLPKHISSVAMQNAHDAEEAGEAPQEVSQITADLVHCIKKAHNDDALAFCVSSFLANAPAKTLRMASWMSSKTRSYGTAGFTDGVGQTGVGWVGFKDNVQSHNKNLWNYQW